MASRRRAVDPWDQTAVSVSREEEHERAALARRMSPLWSCVSAMANLGLKKTVETTTEAKFVDSCFTHLHKAAEVLHSRMREALGATSYETYVPVDWPLYRAADLRRADALLRRVLTEWSSDTGEICGMELVPGIPGHWDALDSADYLLRVQESVKRKATELLDEAEIVLQGAEPGER